MCAPIHELDERMRVDELVDELDELMRVGELISIFPTRGTTTAHTLH